MKKIKLFDIFNTALMIAICFLTIYPLWYILIISFNDGGDALKGGIYWVPREFSLQNYKVVFSNPTIINAFFITIGRTALGTLTAVLFTAMTAYAWSKKNLIGRKFYMTLGLITMFFSGGLIPSFLLIRDLGLYNNFFVYIIPSLFNFFNLIIFQSFFNEIPSSLEESAYMDGANEFIVFVQIILPLSKPVLATICLFHGVWAWNDFFTGSIFVRDNSLEPLATYLYRIIAGSSGANIANFAPGFDVKSGSVTSTSVQLATMVVATVPIVMVYPFLQKYFVKGLLIGSVKG